MQCKHFRRDCGGFIDPRVKRNQARKGKGTRGRKSSPKNNQNGEEGRKIFSESSEENPPEEDPFSTAGFASIPFHPWHTDGALDVLRELEALGPRLKRLTEPQQTAINREIGYFTTHQKRMDYKQAKARGEPVGSGAVEATARQYQTRFKATGQFWSLEGDEALLALATLYRNERWSRLFPHSDPATAEQLMASLTNQSN